MRIRIAFDSADTKSVRELAVALNRVGLTGQLKVGVNGPECWSGETPPLSPSQFASVVANIVKYDDGTIADTLNALRAAK